MRSTELTRCLCAHSADIERTGEFDVALAANLLPDQNLVRHPPRKSGFCVRTRVDGCPQVQNHLFGMEFQEWRCRRNTVKTGKPVYQTCNILDLTGMSLQHMYATRAHAIPAHDSTAARLLTAWLVLTTTALRKAMSLLKGIAALDEVSKPLRQCSREHCSPVCALLTCVLCHKAYYPELHGRIYIVNAPWAFPVIWKVARVFLSKAYKSKIVVSRGRRLAVARTYDTGG